MKKLLLILFVLLPMMLSAQSLVPVRHTNGKWGYKSSALSRDYVLKPKFDDARPFVGDYAFVCKGDVWGIIGKDGKFVVKPKYFYVKGPYNGVQIVLYASKYGFVKGATEITDICYDDVKHLGDCNKFLVRCDGKFGLFDEVSCKLVCEIKYDEIKPNAYDTYLVKVGGKYGLLNSLCQPLTSVKYSDISLSENNTFLVVENGKKGLLNSLGQIIVPAEYDSVVHGGYGTYLVKLNGKYGLLNKQGKSLTKIEYDYIKADGNNTFRVAVNGKKGLLNQLGQVVVPAEYDNVMHYGYDTFLIEESGKYGLLDSAGKVFVSPKYEYVHLVKEDLVALYDGKWSFVDKSGKELDFANRVICYSTNNGAKLSLNDFKGSHHLFYGGNGVLVYDAPVTSIGEYAFDDCKSLTGITIPNNVTSIGAGAFYRCSSLTSATIPDSVASIGSSAFYGCSSLTSVTIGKGVTSIGESAFKYCESLTSITIPNSVTEIGTAAFASCSSLTSITIPNSVTEIGEGAFSGCKNLTSVTIPNSVTGIGEYAFYGCSSLTSVTIPNSVDWIGEEAFSGCNSLVKVNFQRTTPPSICSNSFANTNSNLKIYVPKAALDAYMSGDWSMSTKSLIDGFKMPAGHVITYTTTDGCRLSCSYWYRDESILNSSDLYSHTYENGVGKLVFNSKVTSIGYRDFYDCDKLESITIPNSVTWIGEQAFCGCDDLTSVTIPNSVTSIGKSAFNNCNKLTSITIPNSVTSIGESAFESCDKLKSVTFGNNLAKIGFKAFCCCSSLTTIVIPNSVTYIANAAFERCEKLVGFYGKFATPDHRCLIVNGALKAYAPATSTAEYTIPSNVTVISSGAFLDCDHLVKVVIPDGVTEIEQAAFAYCSQLTVVTIGSKVSSIGAYAFNDCPNLRRIYCKAKTPPASSERMFHYYREGNGWSSYNRFDITIYVPTESVEKYRDTGYWEVYSSVIIPKNY